MIPKTIHYCWFGNKTIPEQYKKYMESWKKHCPEYRIIEWNESNFDINENKYCSEAYSAGKWAFVSDYARLKIIYNYGGVYLDTDVEIIKSFTPLVDKGVGFIGFQNPIEATTGLGFAAPPKNKCIKALLDIYENRSFIMDSGEFNMIPCPASNTVGLMECGLKVDAPWCNKIQELDGIRVYPEEFFNPLNFDTHELNITENTYMIHHYAASWLSGNHKIKMILKNFLPQFLIDIRNKRIANKHIQQIYQEINRCKR